jgi:hypothetical protein
LNVQGQAPLTQQHGHSLAQRIRGLLHAPAMRGTSSPLNTNQQYSDALVFVRSAQVRGVLGSLPGQFVAGV